jgi:hypothetical protein
MDVAFATVLRARMAAIQCIPDPLSPDGYNSAGCNSDCVYNHNYANGTCVRNKPTAIIPGQEVDSDGNVLSCGCFYDDKGSLFRPTN